MFEFAQPWLLLLFPLPWFIYRWFPPAKPLAKIALRVPFFSLLRQLSHQSQLSDSKSALPWWLAYLGWILLVIAAAGPQWLDKTLDVSRTGRDLMLAVDLSGSMQMPDLTLNGMRANRLEVVKATARQFIARRAGDRLGLILFGSRAYLQTPLTFDSATVLAMLEDASIGLAGKETAIGDAIGIAVKRLKAYPNEQKVLILLTDGASNSGAISPLQAAQLAKAAGIRIYTIGVGTDNIIVPGPFGGQMLNPSSDIDAETLQTIAKMTGGLFFRAQDTESLRQIYHVLDKLEPAKAKGEKYRPVKPLYPWPLGAALLLSMWLVWRRIR